MAILFSRLGSPYRGAMFLAVVILLTAPQAVTAHAGHDHEFSGGNGEQVMQPLAIEAATAQVLGLKTTPIKAGDTVVVPTTSVVEANGAQLIYVQRNGTYHPIPVKLGKTQGDSVVLEEGNVKAGDSVVSQGAPLLYSEALRRKPEAATQNKPNATHEHGPHTHTHDGIAGISKKQLAAGVLAGAVTGGGIMFGLSKRQKKPTQE
ncbi:MAG: rane fusion protein cation efflux system [Cyanobacteriota bacterium]|jgi:hypothetical protein